MALAVELLSATGKTPNKMRRDYVQAIEVVCSLPAGTTIDTVSFFNRCWDWCGECFGVHNILTVDVHHDESTPHCHILIAPIESGRWVGGVLISKSRTAALRKSFAATVARPFGLRMGERLMGARKAEAVSLVLGAIEKEHQALFASPVWPLIRQDIERGPARFLQALGLDAPQVRPVKQRTSTQIFTSAGKGPKRETNQPRPQSIPIGISDVRPRGTSNPIGIKSRAKGRASLSCVGIAFPKLRSADSEASSSDASLTVERDFDEQDFKHAATVVLFDEDGNTRERECSQPDPDDYDQTRLYC
ncbi:MAG: plasmid recombination protein [Bdellovibrionales bacterium]|nr:plasmid recombination protein [Ramlibacter sp.]